MVGGNMKGFWKDRKGNNHKISDMPKPYLLNAIKSLRKSMEELVDAVGGDCEDLPEYLDMAEKYLELIEEYFKRVRKYHDFDKSVPISKVHKLEQVELKDEEDKEFWRIVQGGLK
jgi:hypothetical protein